MPTFCEAFSVPNIPYRHHHTSSKDKCESHIFHTSHISSNDLFHFVGGLNIMCYRLRPQRSMSLFCHLPKKSLKSYAFASYAFA